MPQREIDATHLIDAITWHLDMVNVSRNNDDAEAMQRHRSIAQRLEQQLEDVLIAEAGEEVAA